MSSEVIVVKQLPVIVEQLQTIKADVTEKVTSAMNLVCTKETVQTVKEIRAALNAEFRGWEEKRKEVKKAVMLPYEQFETVYKDCITEVFKAADIDLKSKIESVEETLKDETRAEIKAYFEEYLASKHIDFVSFDDAKINITLSASKKKLKEQAKSFIDRICDDLTLIETQEHKDEILYEYKRSLNVSAAIVTVTDRHKAIEVEKSKESERKEKEDAERSAAKKVETIVETLTPPTIEESVEEEPILTVKFTVKGTKMQLKALKEFLKTNNYYFE